MQQPLTSLWHDGRSGVDSMIFFAMQSSYTGWSEGLRQDWLNVDVTRGGKGVTALTASSTRACGRARAPGTVAGQLLRLVFTPMLAKPLHESLLIRVLKRNILFFKVPWPILWRSLQSLQTGEVPAWVSPPKTDMRKAKNALPLV